MTIRRDWRDRPAIGRVTVSSPALYRPFASDPRPYRERVKPFGFALSAHVAPFGHPPSVDPGRFHLLAPYERDGRKWLTLPWIEVYSGKQYAIHTDFAENVESVRVKSHRDVSAFYSTHPEAKSATMDGIPCCRESVGLLQRRPVHATMPVYIGKESNRVEEVEQGLVHAWLEVMQTIEPSNTPAPAFDWGAASLVVLAEQTGLSARYLRAVKNRQREPSTDAQRRIRVALAANRLADISVRPSPLSHPRN
jgi:hypothetical protein